MKNNLDTFEYAWPLQKCELYRDKNTQKIVYALQVTHANAPKIVKILAKLYDIFTDEPTVMAHNPIGHYMVFADIPETISYEKLKNNYTPKGKGVFGDQAQPNN
jgi:hypothetical protein